MVRKAHVSIVLDRSASMESCRAEAVRAVNAYLTELKSERTVQIRLSLFLFNSYAIDAVRDRVPVAHCAALRLEEFVPRGKTPLLDAVGYSAGLLDCLSAKDERRVFAIVTDGLENASREFSQAQLKALLERKQREEGWQVRHLRASAESWADAGQGELVPFSSAARLPTALRAKPFQVPVETALGGARHFDLCGSH